MKKMILCILVALLVVPAFAQQAEVLTGILSKKTTTYMDFSYLIASEIGMECSPFEAYTWCDRFGTFPGNKTANTPMSARTISHFFMTNYGIKANGIMWSLAHSPRYAWKELKNKGFWEAGTDPDTVLTGRDLVRSVRKFFTEYPDAQLRNPPTPEASDKYRKALLAGKEEAK